LRWLTEEDVEKGNDHCQREKGKDNGEDVEEDVEGYIGFVIPDVPEETKIILHEGKYRLI